MVVCKPRKNLPSGLLVSKGWEPLPYTVTVSDEDQTCTLCVTGRTALTNWPNFLSKLDTFPEEETTSDPNGSNHPVK